MATTKRCPLPGYLFLVRFLTDCGFDELYPLVNVVRIDDHRSSDHVIERGHSHLFVEVKDLHWEIALEPEALTMRCQDFAVLDPFQRVGAVVHPDYRQPFVRKFRFESELIGNAVSPGN